MKDPWLLAGYALFARKGPADLKIEVLARQVGKSKSSFYHHFADTEVFIEQLMSYHMERVQRIAVLEQQCLRIVPDLLRLLITVEEDLLFNRQLRSHRTVPAFRKCIETTNREIAKAMLPIWARSFELADRPEVARLLLNLVIDNFYLQLTNQELTYEWLLNYISELRSMVRGMATVDV